MDKVSRWVLLAYAVVFIIGGFLLISGVVGFKSFLPEMKTYGGSMIPDFGNLFLFPVYFLAELFEKAAGLFFIALGICKIYQKDFLDHYAILFGLIPVVISVADVGHNPYLPIKLGLIFLVLILVPVLISRVVKLT